MGETEKRLAPGAGVDEDIGFMCGCADCIRLRDDQWAHRNALARYLRAMSFPVSPSGIVECAI